MFNWQHVANGYNVGQKFLEGWEVDRKESFHAVPVSATEGRAEWHFCISHHGKRFQSNILLRAGGGLGLRREQGPGQGYGQQTDRLGGREGNRFGWTPAMDPLPTQPGGGQLGVSLLGPWAHRTTPKTTGHMQTPSTPPRDHDSKCLLTLPNASRGPESPLQDNPGSRTLGRGL